MRFSGLIVLLLALLAVAWVARTQLRSGSPAVSDSAGQDVRAPGVPAQTTPEQYRGALEDALQQSRDRLADLD